MYSPFQFGIRYIKYYLTASSGKGHGVHSPFVFEFIANVLNDKRHFYAYDSIEQIRQLLLLNNQQISIEDFGAGSRGRLKKMNLRFIKDIAQSSVKSKKFGQLLFRMVDYYAPGTVLELGTSLGITTAYLASAKNSTTVFTLEGSKEIAKVAQNNFSNLQLKNIHQIIGNFDETLPVELDNMGKLDIVFIDGNHRYEPTMRYFLQILPSLDAYSILILDDIHWSKEMDQAWHEIKENPLVMLSIDLFFIGLIFFRKESKIRQHFTIRF